MKDCGHRAAVEAALHFEKGDRIPVNNFALVTAARSAGVLVKDARYDPPVSAKVSIDYALKTKSDFVKPVLDSQVPFADLGMDVRFPADDYGSVRSVLVKTAEDVDNLAFFDPKKAAECPRFTKCIIDSLKICAATLPEDLHICGLSWGPITTAGYLMGVEDMLMMTFEEGDVVKKLVAKTADFIAEQQIAMSEAGASLMWMADPTSSEDIISPDMFGPYSGDFIKHTIGRVKKATGQLSFLHICGNSTDIMPAISATGADCFSFDHAVPINAAVKAAAHRLPLMGNIDPVKYMLMGTPAEITGESDRIMDAAAQDGGFILAPGCETPIAAPDANVIALGTAGENYWKR
ncbi:MAG: uroporphyrinogen decarboxylase family protein [Candidatus Methanomethylophilus sp.]|nr:uroporphyrinogen decarboxylase family protein [Methanomethylophilus sp.]